MEHPILEYINLQWCVPRRSRSHCRRVDSYIGALERINIGLPFDIVTVSDIENHIVSSGLCRNSDEVELMVTLDGPMVESMTQLRLKNGMTIYARRVSK